LGYVKICKLSQMPTCSSCWPDRNLGTIWTSWCPSDITGWFLYLRDIYSSTVTWQWQVY